MAIEVPAAAVSNVFSLTAPPGGFEFLDVNLTTDNRVFIDPLALAALENEWGSNCVALLRSYFAELLRAIQSEDLSKADLLLQNLGEPNETRLGLSKGKARGRGLGQIRGEEIYEALSVSQAVKSGLLSDLEDAALLVPGIGDDLVSDMATNIIRSALFEFTHEVCWKYKIPLSKEEWIFWIWEMHEKCWREFKVRLPVYKGEPILLIPRAIARKRLTQNYRNFEQHYLLVAMQSAEIAAGTSLVRTLKDGTPKVTKKSLREYYGSGKETGSRLLESYASVLPEYKRDILRRLKKELHGKS